MGSQLVRLQWRAPSCTSVPPAAEGKEMGRKGRIGALFSERIKQGPASRRVRQWKSLRIVKFHQKHQARKLWPSGQSNPGQENSLLFQVPRGGFRQIRPLRSSPVRGPPCVPDLSTHAMTHSVLITILGGALMTPILQMMELSLQVRR